MVYVTGFAKTRHIIPQELKSGFLLHMKATLWYYPETQLTELQHKANRVCFYWHHLCNLVNQWQSIVGCTVPLGITYKVHLVWNCFQWPSWPDKYAEPLSVLPWAHMAVFLYQGIETEIWFFVGHDHESHTLVLSRNTIDRATYSKVYFNWHHLCELVNWAY